MKKANKPRKHSPNKGFPARRAPEKPVRERILKAAFAAFMERGYEGASTLEIATRAKVSKREVYALFGNKHAMLAACVGERVEQMRLSLELPPPHNRKALALALTAFGVAVLREVSHPTVLAVHRLAIAEVESSPQVAHTLHTIGRQPSQAVLADFLAAAQARGLIEEGELTKMVMHFFALLWGDLLLQLLLRVADLPSPREIERRARAATDAFLKLHPASENRPGL